MLTLIIGGSASGKSDYAEKHACSLSGERIYIATMEPFGEEAKIRIGRHHEMRKNRGFETIECYTSLKMAPVPEDHNILLEDLGNLLANEMFSPSGGGAEAVLIGVEEVSRKSRHFTIVTNEVFSGGQLYEGDTEKYMRELAKLNRILAKKADRVVEIVCGLPNVLKGESV